MKSVPLEVTMMKRIGELNEENARLKAEVERLTKAGDAMQTYISDFSKICKPQWDVRLAWEAAKLGIEE